MSKPKKASDILIDLLRERGEGQLMIEVGVWKSDTTKKVLKHAHQLIKEYWAVDPWEVMGPDHGRMSRKDTEEWAEMHYYCCRLMTMYFSNLRILKLESSYAANLFKDGYFDIVFLDANHHYRHVLADINLWLPKVKKGGVLVGHDYGNHWYGVKRAVDELFSLDEIELREDNVWMKWI